MDITRFAMKLFIYMLFNSTPYAPFVPKIQLFKRGEAAYIKLCPEFIQQLGQLCLAGYAFITLICSKKWLQA